LNENTVWLNKDFMKSKMQYLKKEDGSFALLPKQNVDFGGGLERLAAATDDEPDIFKTDIFPFKSNIHLLPGAGPVHFKLHIQ